MRKLFLLLSLTFLGAVAQAQYTGSASTSTYTALTGATDLTGGGTWDDSLWTVPIGFNYTIDGVTGNTLFVSSNGFGAIVTATDQKYLLGCFADMESRPGGSPISYQTTGTLGSQIMKIQWSNAGFFSGASTDFINFQMWLYEGSNKFETHYGTSSIAVPNNAFDAPGPAVGIITAIDTADNVTGQFFTGPAGTPTLQTSVAVPVPGSLNSVPASGQVYIMTPTGLAAPAEMARLELVTWPNPVSEVLNLQGLTAPGTAYLYNSLGQLVHTQTLGSGNSQLLLKSLSPGFYQLEVISNNARFSQQLIRQ